MSIYDPDKDVQRTGGGTITFRALLSAALVVMFWLLQSIGSNITTQLGTLTTAQNRMSNLLSKQVQLNSDTAAQSQRNEDHIGDHERRITWLEARSPTPK